VRGTGSGQGQTASSRSRATSRERTSPRPNPTLSQQSRSALRLHAARKAARRLKPLYTRAACHLHLPNSGVVDVTASAALHSCECLRCRLAWSDSQVNGRRAQFRGSGSGKGGARRGAAAARDSDHALGTYTTRCLPANNNNLPTTTGIPVRVAARVQRSWRKHCGTYQLARTAASGSADREGQR
jgi:hypothetical protein